MNKIFKTSLMMVSLGAFLGCADPEYIKPDLGNATPTTLSANFLLVNAVPNATAGSLDLYLNNAMAGASVGRSAGQAGYTNLQIPSNGAIANTAIRAKASTGTIGGVLGSADLIFRAGNTNTTNFTAADSAFYTFIAMDSLERVRPLRTFNTLGIGDTTYFYPLTGAYMAGKDTWVNNPPTFIKSRRVAIGTVPLGITDPGGIRFLVLTDQLPLPSTTRFPKPSAGRFGVRFIHAAPDVGTVTVTLNGTALTSGILSYPLSFPTFNPSVGSRSTTATFANNFANLAPGTYSVVVRLTSSGTPTILTQNVDVSADKGVYTLVLTGQRNKNNLALAVIKNK